MLPQNQYHITDSSGIKIIGVFPWKYRVEVHLPEPVANYFETSEEEAVIDTLVLDMSTYLKRCR